jgi:DNA-3-methyladenine glycosylase II
MVLLNGEGLKHMRQLMSNYSESSAPLYWEDAKKDLMSRDRIMHKLIPKFGNLCLVKKSEAFTTLVYSVVSQQISIRTVESRWRKFLLSYPEINPVEILAAGPEKLAACGLSKRKANCILELANHFKAKKVDVGKWVTMGNEEVISDLTRIRGVGRWAAEMFLIFDLLRPNILPLDDLGLLRSISVNYFSGEPVSRSDAREVSANWDPWKTVATWYLWCSLDLDKENI